MEKAKQNQLELGRVLGVKLQVHGRLRGRVAPVRAGADVLVETFSNR